MEGKTENIQLEKWITVAFVPQSHLCLKSIKIKTIHEIIFILFIQIWEIFLQCPDNTFVTQFRNVVFQSKYIIIWSTGYYLKCFRSLSPIRMSWIPSAAPINVSEAKFTTKPKSTTALFHHYLERDFFLVNNPLHVWYQMMLLSVFTFTTLCVHIIVLLHLAT